uniref:Uncharacterized protein n=1 Tax=Oryza sativa subsp. japonica TaxID=39947 RepID=Q6Z975_ORYSJ|nr:hypothetical protein [Oryza sativa Japonica Group]BAD03390.1 hypothetical protein [Oryza sativa Japonica Group]
MVAAGDQRRGGVAPEREEERGKANGGLRLTPGQRRRREWRPERRKTAARLGMTMATALRQSTGEAERRTGFDNFIDIYIAYVGSFRPELMSGFRPYTASYGDMSSFSGGLSSVPNELRTSQTDDAPHVTQPTQPEVGKGNDNDPRRSNRERHEPNRLSLSGPRHAAGQRKKNYKKARWNI